MRKAIFWRRLILACVVCSLLTAFSPWLSYTNVGNAAPNADIYEIGWYTADSGGAMNLPGGTYTLSGTAGQPDAGAQSNGAYALGGGFWNGVGSLVHLFLPLLQK